MSLLLLSKAQRRSYDTVRRRTSGKHPILRSRRPSGATYHRLLLRSLDTVTSERADPVDRVYAALERALSGAEPGSLVLRGTGAASATLVAALAQVSRPQEFAVAHATGREDDRWAAYRGLGSLLPDAADRLAALPPVQADALRAALGFGTSALPPAPLAVQAAAVSMLSVLAEERPLLVVIDEGQWLDESSARAVLFAAERFVAEPIVVVIAVRDDEPSVFIDSGLEELHVGRVQSSARRCDCHADSTTSPTSTHMDADMADNLERAARRARARGGLFEAKQAWCDAARASPTDETAARRLFEAGNDLWLAGCADAAIELFAQAAQRAVDEPALLAEISLLAGQAVGWHRSPSEAVGCLQTAAVHAANPTTATACLAHAAMFSSVGGDVGRALDLAAQAVARAPADDPVATLLSAAVRGWQLLLAGDPDAMRVLNPLVALAPVVASTGGPDVLTLAQLVGLVLVITERWDEALELLETIVERARPAGWQAASAFSAAALALVRWRRGDWDAAYTAAATGVEDAVGGVVARAWAQSFLAQITAGMGREDEARQLAGEALQIGERTGAAAVSFAARAALGHLELSLGRIGPALEQLDVLAARIPTTGMTETGLLWWQADHIEALALAGRTDAMLAAINQFAETSARADRQWAHGALARTRAMQTSGPESERWFAEALASHDALGAPFERARTLFRRGEARLARGSIAIARDDLEAAQTDFERLGAAAWSKATATRCRTRRANPTSCRPIDRLTHAELRVAVAAAHGKKNREIAAELYLSSKTVDHHLQSIYRKLQVRSRTELALQLTSSTPTVTGAKLPA
jgi:DNA-binding CsgD family transcriptional regulator